MNSTTGTLYRVDPATGHATAVELGGETLTNGFGLRLRGSTPYVVQNQLNQIAAVNLAPDWSSGLVTETLTDAGFDVPTTVAISGSSLYAVIARFGTPPNPDSEYTITKVAIRREIRSWRSADPCLPTTGRDSAGGRDSGERPRTAAWWTKRQCGVPVQERGPTG